MRVGNAIRSIHEPFSCRVTDAVEVLDHFPARSYEIWFGITSLLPRRKRFQRSDLILDGWRFFVSRLTIVKKSDLRLDEPV